MTYLRLPALLAPHRHATFITFVLALLTCVSAEALALDGYEDRRGLTAGLAAGGGLGASDTSSQVGLATIDPGRKLGFHLSGMLGAGITERLTLVADVNWWARSVTLGENQVMSNHYSLNPTLSVFLTEGFFLEGGAGLAYASYDAQRGASQAIERYRELGLGVKGGGGYEVFVNGDVAVGVRLNYTRHFYRHAEFDTIAGAITLRWY